MPKTTPATVSAPKRPTFTIEEAPIMYRNFSGVVSGFNPEGKKSFSVKLDPDFAAMLERDGWHVKVKEPHDQEMEGEVGQHYINIKVNFANRPPRVVMVTPTGMVPLNDKSIRMLDDADIIDVDLTCVGKIWDRGISCYLQKAFFKINMDLLDQKYGFGYLDDEEDDD